MISRKPRIYLLVLLAGDMFIFVAAILLSVFLRNGFVLPADVWEVYRISFAILLCFWIFLLVTFDFYNPWKTFLSLSAFVDLTWVLTSWTFVAVAFFYLSPFFQFTPKIILLLDVFFLYILFIIWRSIIARIITPGQVKFAIIGDSPQLNELTDGISKKKHHLFQCVAQVYSLKDIPRQFFVEKGIEYIVLVNEHMEKEWAAFFFRELFPLGIKIGQFPAFFEEVMQKVPVQSIDTMWFLENFGGVQKNFNDALKRLADIIFVMVLAFPAFVISVFVMFAVLIEHKTKIFYVQERMKKKGKIFRMYKFTSMESDAERHGPQWSRKRDERVTKVGRFIRHMHFDEIPQLWNILKGDMSFVGPRPERPEFVDTLSKEIPFYYERLLVKPGLTGWAQINYPYGENVKDSLHKLQYDLYYIKHRSILFDIEIFLRTFKLLMLQPKK